MSNIQLPGEPAVSAPASMDLTNEIDLSTLSALPTATTDWSHVCSRRSGA